MGDIWFDDVEAVLLAAEASESAYDLTSGNGDEDAFEREALSCRTTWS